MKRHTRSFPCPVCGGADRDARGKSKRCWGFTSDDGAWVRCTREEFAGDKAKYEEASRSWVHHLGGNGDEYRSASDDRPIQVAEYVYEDEEGKPLYKVMRFLPKSFRQSRWDAERNEWVSGQGCMEGVRRVPYRLPELMESSGPVFVVEGEKDVETLARLDIPATCNPGGAGKWRDEYNVHLFERKAVVIPDGDPSGLAHARSVSESLKRTGTNHLVAPLPEGVRDVSAWVDQGATVEEIMALSVRRHDWNRLTDAPQICMADLTDLIGRRIEYAIEPICPKGAITLLQGQPKGGKSTFALYMAIAASIGVWTSGILRIAKPLKVLLVEFEDSPLLVVNRTSRYVAGLGMERTDLPANLFLTDYPRLWMDQNTYKELLVQEIKERKYDLVVIDTLSYIHNVEDENKSTDMKPVLSNLKRIVKETDISIILIHHVGKGGKEKAVSEKARGSSSISATADVILDWGDREKTNVTPVQFISKYDDGFDFRVNYIPQPDGAVQWELEESLEEDQDRRKGEIVSVLAELEKTSPEGVSIRTVVRALPKWSERSVYRYVRTLEDEGKVSVGTGTGSKKMVRIIHDL